MSLDKVGDVTELLRSWVRHAVEGNASVTKAWRLSGGSGLGYGFDVEIPSRQSVIPLVIRLAPPGVRKRGNTDLLRQVPLLEHLHSAGVPVAPVWWYAEDSEWFGTDVLVQQRLDALPLHMTEISLSVAPPGGDVSPLIDQAVDTLASLHAPGLSALLHGWESPRSAADEVHFWTEILNKSKEPHWREAGFRLGQALLDTCPAHHVIGLYHGDYQTNNILYDGNGWLTGVVDWELAGMGAQLLDLGWLSMFTDPSCWHDDYARQMRVVVEPEDLRIRYERATGRKVEQFGWYRGLACYRFGVIATLNIHLHRSGRRVDPSWEDKASSVPTLFGRGLDLLRASERR